MASSIQRGPYFTVDTIPVVILCGGFGTRIRGVSSELPKPMLTIGEKPILWHIMKSYQAHGFRHFIFCLGYKGWKVKEYFLNYHLMNSDFSVSLDGRTAPTLVQPQQDSDLHITFVETGENSMTGHRVWRVRKYLEGTKLFCLTYGDGLSDIDLTELVSQHKQSNAFATVTGVRPVGRFGEICLDGARVIEFNEKPAISAGYINGGFMVLDNENIWRFFRESEELVLEKDVLPSLALEGRLGVYKHHGFWQCMDTYRDYLLLNELWSNQQARWKDNWR